MQLAKRIIPAIFFYLACAFVTFAQSTTVSGTVTDLGAQAWANGPYKFIFTPNPQFPTGPYAWTGGALNNVITGTLDGSGHYSVSIPSNSAITPAGSTWVLQITPDATSQSFSTLATTITGATQTLNATPPAILISWGIPPGPAISAYADGEIGGTLPKGAEYFNVTSSLTRVWNGSSWADQGSGAGGSVSGSGTTGFIPAWTGASSLGNSHCNDGVTTASTVTCAENFAVTGGFNIVMGGGTLFTGTVEGTVADNGLDLFCDPSGGACTVNVGENTANENVAIQGVGLTVTTSAGAVVNGATGGAKGAGTVNALGLFVNGVAISAGGTCPSGAAGSIQFTDGTNCASDANFTWNSVTHSLIAQGVNAASKIASGTGFGNNLTIGASSVVLQAGVGTATLALTSDALMSLTSNSAGIAETAATTLTRSAPTVTDTVGAASAVTPGSATQRAVTGTTDTILSTDRQNRVAYNSTSAVAVTLPQAGTGGFAGGFNTRLSNQNTGVVTITPTASLINGNATLVMQEGQFCFITPSAAGTDYAADCGESQMTAGTGISFTRAVHGLTIAATGITFPQTVAGTVTSGGIPFFDSMTDMSSSALLAANSPILGGGAGVAPSTKTFLTTNGTTTLNIGVVGGGNGQLSLCGNVSGCATITAPATAGTASNPFTLSNALQAGGTISTTTGGILSDATHNIGWTGRSLFASSADGIVTVTNNANNGFTRWVFGPDTSSFPAVCDSGTTILVGAGGANCTTLSGVTTGTLKGNLYATGTNCSSSGGTCTAAPAGSVSIAAAATTVTVATTAVTANSQIFVQEDSSLGTKLGVTCNTTIARTYAVTTRTAGTSIVITASAAPTVNPACLSYWVLN